MANIVKARYWTVVLYPEDMVQYWERDIDLLLQYPCAYCIHDKDLNNKFSEYRKTHVHFLIAFPNTTTLNHVIKLFQRLSPNCKYAEAVINIEYMYKYLIHDTENSRKCGKYLYSVEERILVNNFDIGCYIQISSAEKREVWKFLRNFVLNNKICNIVDLEIAIDSFTVYGSDILEIVIKENHSYFERLCRGNWFKYVWCSK